jgi:hypothetical protein
LTLGCWHPVCLTEFVPDKILRRIMKTQTRSVFKNVLPLCGVDLAVVTPQCVSAKVVRFIPNIPVTGNYQVCEWHTQGASRPTNAPFPIAGGNCPPVMATVIHDNFTGSAGNADAVKLVFISQ